MSIQYLILIWTIYSDKIYLFKSGIFFIALNEDATKLSEIFGFKITNLNDTVTKCGFPAKRIEYYSSLLDKMNIDFELIDSNSKKIENSSEYISNLNFNSIIDIKIYKVAKAIFIDLLVWE